VVRGTSSLACRLDSFSYEMNTREEPKKIRAVS
jgi:hypothetical protein